ncbi:hypothetical protein BH09MYX1_BH09MYX1_27470 [soil metagenome]
MKAAWALFLVACGTGSVPVEQHDASIDAEIETGPTELIDGFSPLIDAEPTENVGLVDGGGPFLCGYCICDGRTRYCNTTEKFPALDPNFGDASACGDAGRCLPYPSGCLPTPTCACLAKAGACSCDRSAVGDGLSAGCFYP